jgi:hypothetical protein
MLRASCRHACRCCALYRGANQLALLSLASHTDMRFPLSPRMLPNLVLRVCLLRRRRDACLASPAPRSGKQAVSTGAMQGLAIMNRNSEFMKLGGVVVLSAVLSQGLVDVESQYLITMFGFRQADFAKLYIIFGVGGILVQVPL